MIFPLLPRSCGAYLLSYDFYLTLPLSSIMLDSDHHDVGLAGKFVLCQIYSILFVLIILQDLLIQTRTDLLSTKGYLGDQYFLQHIIWGEKTQISSVDTRTFHVLMCAHGLYYRNCTIVGVIAPDNASLHPEGDFLLGSSVGLSNARRSFQLMAPDVRGLSAPDVRGLSSLQEDFETAVLNIKLLQDSICSNKSGILSTHGRGETTSHRFTFSIPVFSHKVSNYLKPFVSHPLNLYHSTGPTISSSVSSFLCLSLGI